MVGNAFVFIIETSQTLRHTIVSVCVNLLVVDFVYISEDEFVMREK